MDQLLKSIPPSRSPIGGIITSFTKLWTRPLNAPPTTIPTARSTMLPRSANSLNSVIMLMGGSGSGRRERRVRSEGHLQSGGEDRVGRLEGRLGFVVVPHGVGGLEPEVPRDRGDQGAGAVDPEIAAIHQVREELDQLVERGVGPEEIGRAH